MLAYITRRIFTAFLTMLFTVFAVSMMIFLVPGDPVDVMLSEGGDVSAEKREEIRESLGLNEPVLMQFPIFLGKVIRGDLGKTIIGNQPILPYLLDKTPNTLLLAAAGLFIAVVIGVPLGFLAAYHMGSIFDSLLMLGATFGISMPQFWLGLTLLVFFSMKLGWFAVAGSGLSSLILPAFTAGLINAAKISRMARSTMVEVLSEDYITSARAKGLTEKIVVMRHAVKPSMVGVVGIIGHTFTWTMGGQIIVESVFAWDGLGQVAVGALLSREYPLIQAYVLFYSSIVVVISLLIDLAYAALDPRIRYD